MPLSRFLTFPILLPMLLGVGLLVSLIVLGLIVHRIKTWTD